MKTLRRVRDTLAVLAAGMAIGVCLVAWKSNPAIEGAVFPVMDRDFVFINPQPFREGVVFSGEATKIRDCKHFETVVWLGRRGFGVGAFLTAKPHLDPPKMRPSGRLAWDRIYVPIAPERLNETYADVTHLCGRRKVTSKFWG